MSAPPTYSTEEERRDAARLAGEPSDEELEASLRDEAHHHRPTAFVPGGEALEAEGDKTAEAPKGGHPKQQSHRQSGETTAAETAQRDRELYVVRDTTKLDAVRHRVACRSGRLQLRPRRRPPPDLRRRVIRRRAFATARCAREARGAAACTDATQTRDACR